MRKLSFVFNNLSDPIKKVLGNTGWLISDRIIRMAVGLFVAAWVARYLGPNQYGLLNFSIALVAIIGVLSTLGLEQLILRNIVQNPDRRDELLGTAFVLKSVAGIIVFLLSLLAISIIRPGNDYSYLLVTIIAAGSIFQSFDVIEFYFRSQVEAKYPVIVKSIAFILINVFKVILILSNADLYMFAWAFLGELLLGAFGLITAYKLYGNTIKRWKVKLKVVKELFSEGWLLALASVAAIIYMKIDQIMLGQMINDAEVGIYSAAVKLSEICYVIPLAIIRSVAPAITKTYQQDFSKYNIRLQKVFNILTLIGIIIVLPITFFSNSIIDLIFGAKYNASASVLSIHIWTLILVGWLLTTNLSLITEKLIKIILIASMLGAVSNVLMNLALIPVYKGNGAAIATLISYFISTTLTISFFSKPRRIVLMQMKSIFRFYDIKPE
jgi:O-antigen/teichoic acid export membrane protein